MYQRTVAAYRHPDRKTGRTMLAALITTLSAGVPKPLQEVITLGRTLKKRAADVLAYFDGPGTSNGPTEAINGRLEHLRGSAWAFATSPTTSPDPYWKPADSDPNYTPDCEEPLIRPSNLRPTRRAPSFDGLRGFVKRSRRQTADVSAPYARYDQKSFIGVAYKSEGGDDVLRAAVPRQIAQSSVDSRGVKSGRGCDRCVEQFELYR